MSKATQLEGQMSDFDAAEFTKVDRHVQWTPPALVPVQDEVKVLPPRVAKWLTDSCPIEVTL